jgi:predicted ribosomally synthesized peptide with SipW-like signal peptide
MTDEYELSRRKTLAGLATIGAAGAGAGLGTSAYFSDEESFDGNEMVAGELDLKVGWQQIYYGGTVGNAIRPRDSQDGQFINAHPDHDDDGQQSIDTGDGVFTWNDGGPTGIGSVHFHGTIEMTVDGTSVDFGDPKYVRPREYPAFHFDAPNDPRWHVHAQGVTLRYALGTLGIELERNSLTFEGVTYVESDPRTTIIVEVDGASVDPEYVLQPDDQIRIVVSVG